MKTFSKTDIGMVREVNQDYVYVSDLPVGKLPNLFIVADGMGGHKAGEFASRFTVEVLKDALAKSTEEGPEAMIRQAITSANQRLLETAKQDSKLEGMGTTLVVATVIERTLYFANVGDSRLYLLNNDIKQVSKDHSLVQEMVRLGGIKQEDAKNHPDKNIITRAVGAGRDINADYFEFSLTKESILLMCSDGLSNMVEDEQIAILLKSAKTPEKIGKKLIETANRNGGKDNIAVIVIHSNSGEV